MRILHAELDDFRNIAHTELDPFRTFTALVGPNGQGKTNTLEAIYFIAALRPLRNVQRRALIRTGATASSIRVRVESAKTGLLHDLEVRLEPRARTLLKDSKRCDTTSFLGLLVAVAFTPDDLALPKSGPDPRRRFLDRALLNVQPAYLERALRYARAIKERNRLLVDHAADDLLDAYDRVVAREGGAITRSRATYVRELAPMVESHFQRIATPAPVLKVRYVSSYAEEPDPMTEAELVEHFLERLRSRRRVDRARGTTSLGPHHDDVELTLAGESVRERASQGQHRAIVLAIKLAEIAHLTERIGEAPVLLLDDMSSELDPVRSHQLFDAVAGLEGQVILTSTEEPRALLASLAGRTPVAIYDVHEGRLTARARNTTPAGA